MLPILALAPLIVGASANSVLGVSPGKQALYTANEEGKWHCLGDPSIELSFEQINDDVCDCPDGSDEPGTNACAFTKESPKYFYCANEGYKEAYIENFKLNDGVCDYEICCDGSDEYMSSACPNVCDQVKAQFDEFLGSRKATVGQALKLKASLQDKASRLRQQLDNDAKKVENEISQLEAQLASLKEELEREMVGDDSNSAPVSSVLDTVVSEHSRQLEQRFSQYDAHSRQAKERVQRLEGILENLLHHYNPNFNDQAVKQAVSSYADYVSNKPEEESEPSFEVSEVGLNKLLQDLKSVVPSVQSPGSGSETSLLGRILQIPFSFSGKSEQPVLLETDNAEAGSSSETSQQVSSQIDDLEKTIQHKKSEQSIYVDGLNADFGDNGIYRAVKGQWVNKKIGEYNYKLGFLDSLYQDDTLVGRFYGVQGNSMYFAHGSKCWNGPQRSAQVDMVCGSKHELVSVSEPEKCQYRFLMNSPLACEELSDEEIARDFKVDRRKLQV